MLLEMSWQSFPLSFSSCSNTNIIICLSGTTSWYRLHMSSWLLFLFSLWHPVPVRAMLISNLWLHFYLLTFFLSLFGFERISVQFCFHNKNKKQSRIAELRIDHRISLSLICVHLHTVSSAHKMVNVKTTWVEVTCVHGYCGLLQVKSSMPPHLLTANWYLQDKKKAVCHLSVSLGLPQIWNLSSAYTELLTETSGPLIL